VGSAETEVSGRTLRLDAAYYINLDRRTDRQAAMEKRLQEWHTYKGLPPVVRVPGVDESAPPGWMSDGAWGCFESHRRLFGQLVDKGYRKGVLVLEDDADIPPEFPEKVIRLLENFFKHNHPWSMIYLGGIPEKRGRMGGTLLEWLPRRHWAQDQCGAVGRAFRVSRTHAYIIREPILTELWKHLANCHNLDVDTAIADFTESNRKYHAYFVDMVRQDGSKSDLR